MAASGLGAEKLSGRRTTERGSSGRRASGRNTSGQSTSTVEQLGTEHLGAEHVEAGRVRGGTEQSMSCGVDVSRDGTKREHAEPLDFFERSGSVTISYSGWLRSTLLKQAARRICSSLQPNAT
jgi:hypothetical protein